MVKCAKFEVDIIILIKSTGFLLQSPRNHWQLQTDTKKTSEIINL